MKIVHSRLMTAASIQKAIRKTARGSAFLGHLVWLLPAAIWFVWTSNAVAAPSISTGHGLLPFIAVVLLSAVVAGLVGALIGLGGGIVVIPVLTLCFDVHIRYAIGASVVASIATSCSGASGYVRDRLANVRVAILLEVVTTVGALLGAYLSTRSKPSILYLLYGVVLLVSVPPLIRRLGQELPEGVVPDRLSCGLELGGSYHDLVLGRQVVYRAGKSIVSLAIMTVAGVISGMLGIGSGFFKVFAMDVAMQLPMKVSTATSNFMIGVTVATSAWVFFNLGYIHPLVGAPVALGCLAGSQLGAKLLRRLSNKGVRMIFVPVILWVALQMMWKGLGQ